jgi:hypothetical protein
MAARPTGGNRSHISHEPQKDRVVRAQADLARATRQQAEIMELILQELVLIRVALEASVPPGPP